MCIVIISVVCAKFSCGVAHLFLCPRWQTCAASVQHRIPYFHAAEPSVWLNMAILIF